jgi:hypothetical protein
MRGFKFNIPQAGRRLRMGGYLPKDGFLILHGLPLRPAGRSGFPTTIRSYIRRPRSFARRSPESSLTLTRPQRLFRSPPVRS